MIRRKKVSNPVAVGRLDRLRLKDPKLYKRMLRYYEAKEADDRWGRVLGLDGSTIDKGFKKVK